MDLLLTPKQVIQNQFFEGNRTQHYVQAGKAVPPPFARQIAEVVHELVHPRSAPTRGAGLQSPDGRTA